MRVQGYHANLVVGASYMRTQPARPRTPTSRMEFTGVDVRWMRDGVQLRGEWVDGQPNDSRHTRGGYIDAFVHRRQMGPVTALARIEMLDFTGGRTPVYARRATLGARVLIADGLYASVNGSRQTGAIYSQFRNSVDLGLTYTIRFAK